MTASPRKSRSSIEALGVKELVENLLEANATYAEIQQTVFEQTAQKISLAAISRFRAKWSGAQERLARAGAEAQALVAVLTEHPSADLVDAGMGLLLGKLVKKFSDAEESFDKADLVELGFLLNRTARTDHLGKALKLQEERLALLKKKVEDVADKVMDTVKGKGIDPETLKKIREEIYGLVPEAEEAAA
ncbi:phage protein Gp27 family protein [Candidatus Nitronereus thalassa]|uniref:DUF3486 family protein n=1 Tax=Candidatus Nitronereus thalassa TaxID=3020898 RepID=A0ABU3K3A7_9BACT|nr:phage protein Gp27 family protein [Candidatus Nitronereus thalassa]MDT7040859.1 DUF3486 family protein [Candidatus Nitronereus thalassa]